MSTKDTITRVYRETIAAYGETGVNRAEAIESAAATLMIEVRAGRLDIDLEGAIRGELRKADESDGQSADRILKRAAYGEMPLVDDDLDVIVTLGGGLRKAWRDVTPSDLKQMNDLRFENYRKVKDSYSEFNAAYLAIREVVFAHRTFGEAWHAGGFPPAGETAGVA